MKERIDELLKGIERGSIVGDIGCDHGYLLIQGIKQGVIKEGIGIEVVKGPYQRALQHMKEYELSEKVDIRLGSGLSPIKKGEVDTLVIAGMGGGTIVDILRNDEEEGKVLDSVRRLVLQPMSSEEKVRTYLKEKGFTLIDESLLIDKKVYVFMIWERGSWKWEDPFLLKVGPVLYEKRNTLGDLWKSYIESHIKGLEHQLKGLRKGKETEDKIEKALEEKKKWEVLLNDDF